MGLILWGSYVAPIDVDKATGHKCEVIEQRSISLEATLILGPSLQIIEDLSGKTPVCDYAAILNVSRNRHPFRLAIKTVANVERRRYSRDSDVTMCSASRYDVIGLCRWLDCLA